MTSETIVYESAPELYQAMIRLLESGKGTITASQVSQRVLNELGEIQHTEPTEIMGLIEDDWSIAPHTHPNPVGLLNPYVHMRGGAQLNTSCVEVDDMIVGYHIALEAFGAMWDDIQSFLRQQVVRHDKVLFLIGDTTLKPHQVSGELENVADPNSEDRQILLLNESIRSTLRDPLLPPAFREVLVSFLVKAQESMPNKTPIEWQKYFYRIIERYEIHMREVLGGVRTRPLSIGSISRHPYSKQKRASIKDMLRDNIDNPLPMATKGL